MLASASGRSEMVKFLIEEGAEVDVQSEPGATVLSRAKEAHEKNSGGRPHLQVISLLKQAGATQ